jgi:hypothetical protein
MPTRLTVSLLTITRSEQSLASAHRRVLACRADQRSEARYASLCSIARIMGGLAAVRQKFHLARCSNLRSHLYQLALATSIPARTLNWYPAICPAS